MAESRHSTRRAFLKSAPIAATALLVPATAEALEEAPVERVNRLGWELAHALNDYADGNAHAMVYPSDKRELAVGFMFDLHETQEQKVKRLVRNLQYEMAQLPVMETVGGGAHEIKFSEDSYLRLSAATAVDGRLVMVGMVPALNT